MGGRGLFDTLFCHSFSFSLRHLRWFRYLSIVLPDDIETTVLSYEMRRKSRCIKGALENYNICLFTFCTKENFKINQTKTFSRFDQCVFSLFDFFFLWTASSAECHIDHCIVYFLEVDFKKAKLLEISIFLKTWAELKCKNQYAVIIYANNSFGNGDDVTLAQCPFNFTSVLSSSFIFLINNILVPFNKWHK